MICFAYLPKGANRRRAATLIEGRRFDLLCFRDPSQGPSYPQCVEQPEKDAFRFFAGRLAGDPVTDALPASHAVSRPDPLDWQMEPEPDGSWLALKFDGQGDRLGAGSDPCLLQRWYYVEQDGGVYLSNSLFYLKEILGGALAVNTAAIPYMLRWGYLPLHHTPLRNVFSLRGGEFLHVENGKLAVSLRRAPAYLLNRTADPEAAARIAPLLKEAVCKELHTLDSICLPLSGGLDSRFLLGCALEVFEAKRITTLTFGREESLDFEIGTGLAKLVGVPSRRLAFDSRTVGELLREAFPVSEGVYDSVPNHPVSAFREAARDFPLLLSGYVGDVVFGSYELSDQDANRLECDPHELLNLIEATAGLVSKTAAQTLLAEKDSDPLRVDETFLKLEGPPRDRYSRWLWENHQFNRTNFAVELHRDLTFYLTPFVHDDVMRAAYRLPVEARRDERAFLEAMRTAFPGLYSYPTKSNHGFPADVQSGFRYFAVRGWRKLRLALDDALGARTGRIYYDHPRDNYSHSRELLQERHRKDILAALRRLREQPAFDSDALARLISDISNHKMLSRPLLCGLLTVDGWFSRYGS